MGTVRTQHYVLRTELANASRNGGQSHRDANGNNGPNKQQPVASTARCTAGVSSGRQLALFRAAGCTGEAGLFSPAFDAKICRVADIRHEYVTRGVSLHLLSCRTTLVCTNRVHRFFAFSLRASPSEPKTCSSSSCSKSLACKPSVRPQGHLSQTRVAPVNFDHVGLERSRRMRKATPHLGGR